MKKWDTVKLGEVVKLSGGGTPSKSEPLYWDGDIPWASLKDLKNDKIDKTEDTITQLGLENSAASLVEPGSLILATRMAPGRVAKTTIRTAINQDLKQLSVISNLHIDFLFYFLKSKETYFNSISSGATVKGIKIDDILSVSIPLPPLPEQRRIAALLDTADALRQHSRALLEQYNLLAQSLFLDTFSEFKNTVTISEITAEGKNKMRSGPFGSDLLHSEFVSSGIPVLGIDNVVENRFKWGQLRFITEEKFLTLNRYQVYEDDILITIMGTTGRCCIVPKGIGVAINSKHLAAITLDRQKVHPLFVAFNIHSNPDVISQLNSRSRGAIMAGLNLGLIKGIKIPLPPLPLQEKFASMIEAIEGQKAQAEAALAESDALFASLLQQAFEG